MSAEPLDGSGASSIAEIASASAEIEQPGFPVANALDGKPDTGWGIHDPKLPLNRDRAATFTFRQAIAFEGGARITLRLRQDLGGGHTIGRFRLSIGSTRTAEPPGNRPSARQLADAAFEDWWDGERGKVAAWRPLTPESASANYPYLVHEGDGVIFAGGDTSKHDIYSIQFAPQQAPITALRLEALPDERLPGRGPAPPSTRGARATST